MTMINADGSTTDFSNTVNPDDTTQSSTDESMVTQSPGQGMSLKGDSVQLGDVTVNKLDILIVLIVLHWVYMAYKVDN